MFILRHSINANMAAFDRQQWGNGSPRTWVDKQMAARSFKKVNAWAKSQSKKAERIISDTKPATEEARLRRNSAKRYRRWIARILVELEKWQRIYEPAPAPLWQRSKLGAYGLEVAVHKARQAAHIDPPSPR